MGSHNIHNAIVGSLCGVYSLMLPPPAHFHAYQASYSRIILIAKGVMVM